MITSALFGKAGLTIALIGAGLVGGIFVQQKVLNDKKIDYDEIRGIVSQELGKVPPPTVSVQPFDVDKIKGLKEFNYSPNYTGNIAVNGVDSSAVRRWIEQSVIRAIEKHVPPAKKGLFKRLDHPVPYGGELKQYERYIMVLADDYVAQPEPYFTLDTACFSLGFEMTPTDLDNTSSITIEQ